MDDDSNVVPLPLPEPVGDNRPPVYYETISGLRVLVIRASAIGSPCLWELGAAGQGIEPGPLPQALTVAFKDGNDLEPVVIKMLEDKGWLFESHQSEGELWLSNKVVVRYHSDGIGNPRIDEWPSILPSHVIEVKALSNGLWQKARSHGVESTIDEYAWQLSVMMIHSGLPGVWVAYNKGEPRDENGVRPPCEDQGKLFIQYVDEPLVGLTEIELKASLIVAEVEGEDLLTSDKACNSPTQWPCRYLHIRPEPEEVDVKGWLEVDEEDQEEVDWLIKTYLHNKGIVKEAEERQETAKAKLLEIGQGYKGIATDKFHIPLVGGSNSRTDLGLLTDDEIAQFNALKAKAKKKTTYTYIRDVKRKD